MGFSCHVFFVSTVQAVLFNFIVYSRHRIGQDFLDVYGADIGGAALEPFLFRIIEGKVPKIQMKAGVYIVHFDIFFA